MEEHEEDSKNKGIAISSNQKCKVYRTFNIIIIALRHEKKFSPGSALRCYSCWGVDCRDPYSGNPAHEVDCPQGWDFCSKIGNFNGKWLQNVHLNIYIRQSHEISQNI